MNTTEVRKKIYSFVENADEEQLIRLLDVMHQNIKPDDFPDDSEEIIKRRIHEVETGKVKLIPAHEVTKRLEEKLMKKYGKNS